MRRIAKLSFLLAPIFMASLSGCATSSWMSGSPATDPREARISRLMSVAADFESQGKHDSAMRVYEHVLAQYPEHPEAQQRRELLAQQGIKSGGRPLKSEPSTIARELYASAARPRSVVPLGSENNTAEDAVTTIHRKNAELAQVLAKKKYSTHPLVAIPTSHNPFDNQLEPTPVAEQSLIVESKANLVNIIDSVSGSVEDPGWVAAGTSNSWTLVAKDSTFPSGWRAASDENFQSFVETESSEETKVATVTTSQEQNGDEWFMAVAAKKPAEVPTAKFEAEDGWQTTPTSSVVDLVATSTETSQDAWQTADLTREQLVSESVATAQAEAAPIEPVQTEPVQFQSAQNRATRHLSLLELCDKLPSHIRPLVEKLEHPDPVKRIEGLLELGELKEEAEAAGVGVYAMMEDADPIVAIYAATTLRQITGDSWSSVHTLISYLEHSDPGIAQLAAYLLGQIGPEAMDAVPALEKLRNNGDQLTSLHASEALTHIAPADSVSVQKLAEALKSGDREIRWFAAVSLGSVTGACEAQAAQALKEALRDGETEVQVAACLSLGGLGANAVIAIPELEQASQSDVEDVKSAAETALACLRG